MMDIKILCVNHAQALPGMRAEGERRLIDFIRAEADTIKKILNGEEVDHSASDAFWDSLQQS
ncbi:hypothetical protein [Serratia fonticola]|uniref:hypothetical protein n=1 Tax=Serratia fonticola TaxID=47917 RepID=UPI001377E5BA|nr:hypothetical protein [Serratia fonticola]NCG55194.1 hypothetical protein [Serratia fonticola]